MGVVTGGNVGRQVTEEEVRRAMSQAIVRQVLSMGIDASRVKMAIKNQLESSGNAFESAEHLINAANRNKSLLPFQQNFESWRPRATTRMPTPLHPQLQSLDPRKTTLSQRMPD